VWEHVERKEKAEGGGGVRHLSLAKIGVMNLYYVHTCCLMLLITLDHDSTDLIVLTNSYSLSVLAIFGLKYIKSN
jgi:hypothetical protein